MDALLVLMLQDSCAQSTNTLNYNCDDGDYSCTSCFNKLAHELISSSKNQFEIQRVFFPPNGSTPVFVVVHYHYEIDADMDPNMTEVWYWSASIIIIILLAV